MQGGLDDEEQSLKLTLSPPGSIHQEQQQRAGPAAPAGAEEESKKRKLRSNSSSAQEQQQQSQRMKEDRIVPAYPWSSDRRAVMHSLDFLRSRGIEKLHGEVVCKRCDGPQMFEVSIDSCFSAVNDFFLANRDTMHDRAPKIWTTPRLLDCSMCQQSDCVRPVISAKKRNINWLFLLLTQTLGLCTLDQLKYFCKHTRRHRTGAKDRVLYLTYVGLLKQLNPSGPYD